MNQPETARALLHRYGLPEDVIDGALCLHAQELAAVQRLRMDELDLTGQKARFIGRIVDLIDPTKTAAVSSAGQAPATDQTALRDELAKVTEQRDHWHHEVRCADARLRELERRVRDLQSAAVLPAPVAQAAVLRWAADHLDTSERLRDLTDDHMLDINAAANELRRLADETPDTQTEAACVCGHPVRLHHEDVCQLTGCGCADALEISALPEALEALLTKKFTELGNPFSRMRRQEQGPDGWPAEHPVGPHHVAEALRELLRQAADSGPELRLPDHTVNEAESPDDPLRPAPRNRHRAAWDALTPQQQATYLAQLADDEPAAGARQDGAQR